MRASAGTLIGLLLLGSLVAPVSVGAKLYPAQTTDITSRAYTLEKTNRKQLAVLHDTLLNTFAVVTPQRSLELQGDGGNNKNRYAPAATMVFDETRNSTGWDYVYAAGEPGMLADPGQQNLAYRAAGFGEGYLTHQALQWAGVEGAFSQSTYGGARELAFVKEHLQYMRNQIAENPTDVYWVQIHLLFEQMTGIAHGYANRTGKTATFEDVFTLNYGNEIGDVQMLIQEQESQQTGGKNANGGGEAPFRQSHCSALIKITEDDLYVSHDTWSSFGSMQRQYKVYAFNTTVTMSGYPGQIASGDDWYMTSNKLAVQETTNEFYNTSLALEISPQSVSEFLRVMVATYQTTNGADWVSVFARENSGTYNNQYMVVDMKLWTPGTNLTSLKAGLLWVTEQLPGLVVSGDQTEVLRNTSYWASFNLPFNPEIYRRGGFEQKYQEQGSFWSYRDYARSEIFRRNQTNVADLTTMMQLMRFNDFQRDPLSEIPNCGTCPNQVCDPTNSAMLTIASRGDLNPIAMKDTCYGPLKSFVGHRDHCATDAKIATWSNFQSTTLTGIAISGPTAYNGLPIFAFSDHTDIARPIGLPNRWTFGWQAFQTPQPPPYTAPHIAIPYETWRVVVSVVLSALFGAFIGGFGTVHARRSAGGESAAAAAAYSNLASGGTQQKVSQSSLDEE